MGRDERELFFRSQRITRSFSGCTIGSLRVHSYIQTLI